MVSSSQDAFAKRICSLSSAALRELLLLSDYKFPTRLVDAFLLAQPTFAFIQNSEITQDVVRLSFLKNQTGMGDFFGCPKRYVTPA
jgi:hypothetical protein